MSLLLVVMGVAGCGKSSLGSALAQALGCPLIEGDDFHTEANREKMRRGVALDDRDREGWLDRLAAEMRLFPRGAVLTCSALKRKYRDRLRAALPGLRFAYLRIDEAQARARVSARAEHMFPPSLVPSQFAALEPPEGEAGVLTLDAQRPVDELARHTLRWLQREGA
ncbi:MAG: gluconokinase [Pseudomonadota bacterium]